MSLKQTVPEYLTNKRNTIIQIGFTALFAWVFINVYLPFGAEQWYNINNLQFRLLSGVTVLMGMVVIIIIRWFMFVLQRSYEVTLAHYIWMIVTEVILLGLFFTSIEKLVLKDSRSTLYLMINATQNTVLILLIPYILSSLFFAWSHIKKRLEQVIHQFRDPSEVFIIFKDEKGKVRITLRLIDILYLEANDNYVNIVFLDKAIPKTYMLRNSIKKLDAEVSKYSIIRCHRKYSLNKVNVKFLRKGKINYEAVMSDVNQTVLPVSKSYQKIVLSKLNMEA